METQNINSVGNVPVRDRTVDYNEVPIKETETYSPQMKEYDDLIAESQRLDEAAKQSATAGGSGLTLETESKKSGPSDEAIAIGSSAILDMNKGALAEADERYKKGMENIDVLKKADTKSRQLESDAKADQIALREQFMKDREAQISQLEQAKQLAEFKMDKTLDEYDRLKVFPLRAIANMSVGRVMANGMAQFMALQRGDNASLERLQRSYDAAIDRDIKAQMEEIAMGKAKSDNILAFLRQQIPALTTDLASAKDALKLTYMDAQLLTLQKKKLENPSVEMLDKLNSAELSFMEKRDELREKIRSRGIDKVMKLVESQKSEIKTTTKVDQAKTAEAAAKASMQSSLIRSRDEQTIKDVNSNIEGIDTALRIAPYAGDIDGSGNYQVVFSKIKESLGYQDQLAQNANQLVAAYVKTFGHNPSNIDLQKVEELIKGGAFNNDEFLSHMLERIFKHSAGKILIRGRTKNKDGVSVISPDVMKKGRKAAKMAAVFRKYNKSLDKKDKNSSKYTKMLDEIRSTLQQTEGTL